MRVFESSGLNPTGKVLSFDDFRLMRDVEQPIYTPEKMQKVVENAEEILNQDITVLTLWAHRQYQAQGSRDIYDRDWAKRISNIMHLSLAEFYEKKGRFTEKLADYLWAVLEESWWMQPAHSSVTPLGITTDVPLVAGNKYLHGIELGSSYRASILAMVYRFNRKELDDISPLICDRIEKALHERCIDPFMNCTFHWYGEFGVKINNWCPWCLKNTLFTIAMVEKDDYVRETAVKRAMRYLDNFISGYSEEGGCEEGPGYWGSAGGSMFDCLEILYDMTGGYLDVFDTPIIKNMGEYAVKMNVCDDRFANFADSGPSIVHDGHMMMRYGKKCASPELISLGGRMAEIRDTALKYSHIYRTLRNLASPDLEGGSTPQVAKKTVYLPDIQIANLRDSENPKVGLTFVMKAGHNGESHNHNDVGSFVLYNGGVPVLVDAGAGAYTKRTFGALRYTLWNNRSEYHNVGMFNGMGQRNGKAFAARDVSFDESKRELKAELAGCYESEAGVESYVRCGSLNSGKVALTDYVRLSNEGECDFIFLTYIEPKITDKGILLHTGLTLSYSEGLTPEIEGFITQDYDSMAKWGVDRLWRIHLKARCKEGTFTFTIT